MLIKNAFVTDPGSQRAGISDIRIEDGRIREISPDISSSPSEEILDAHGLTAAPGLIDTHVHFRDPGFTHKETLHTGALAAARGGFTSVICMANTSPVVDSVPVLKDILDRAKEEPISPAPKEPPDRLPGPRNNAGLPHDIPWPQTAGPPSPLPGRRSPRKPRPDK